MTPKILIIGSTGKLGLKLINFCFKENIPINTITCFRNDILLKKIKDKFSIKYGYSLSNKIDLNNFLQSISSTKFDIIYFLDHGALSLSLMSHIIRYQIKSYIAVANKEMLIAGGSLLIKEISKSNNYFIPLDSEHYSLFNSKLNNQEINKIYITASGGPLYFNKKIDFKKVSRHKVLSHPKWKMGKNNLIDSSNFVNKILEIHELSLIFDISLDKIDFILSPEAYVHSLIEYNNGITCLNCFNNDMLITLTSPLRYFYKINLKKSRNDYFNQKNFYFEKPIDKRFKVLKYINFLKNLKHSQVIEFMILNNKAQKEYLSGNLNYNMILNFILKKIDLKSNRRFSNFESIINYVHFVKGKYI